MDGQNITKWDVLMQLEETQESITHLNKFCLDMTCLNDSLKHSVLDYADGKAEGKDLYVHNDMLTKETSNCANIIDDAIKDLEDCRTLINKFLENN
ncbi:MAG: hypothetical protein E7Z77_08980 [Methanobrevibacter sp.]|uniref:hypothetical protein n=1 Tax=Methanobrevibacter sp. TaxID=66852 RepID=UPI0025EC635C|nr:hypothetical protein [Methanobrevibacter sp.]MBE6509527.1 hypothetical protein [Methanobrevibacter sp.]